MLRNTSSQHKLSHKPQRDSWGPVAAICVSLLAIVTSQLLAVGLLYLVLGLGGWSISRSTNWISGITGGFFSVLLIEGLVLLTIWVFFHYRKIEWQLLGFKRRPRLRDVGLAIIGFVIYFVTLLIAASIGSALFHLNLGQKQELGFDTVVGLSQKLLTFVSLVILPPISEEVLFRGLLFNGLRTKFSFVWSALFTSACFASLHLFEGSGSLFWVGALDTFILSLVLCRLRERTGNLWAGILVHMLKNGVAFLSLYVFVSK